MDQCLSSDIRDVIELAKDRDYEVDLFEDLLADGVVRKDGKIIAYGAIKKFSEAVILLENGTSKEDRITALYDLFAHAHQEMKKAGLSQLHVFTKDRAYANLLSKRLGFRRINRIALVRDING